MISEKIDKIMTEVLGVSGDYEMSNLDIESCSLWDSLSHLRLIDAIENEFSIELSFEQKLELTSYKKILSVLSLK